MDRLRQLLDQSQRIVVFTGAGISVDSGIPDFRTPGGIWSRIDPMTLHRDAIEGGPKRRATFWEAMLALSDSLGDPQPNASHHAVAKLGQMDKLVGVVTQNVDGLHQAAGTPPGDVIELHGNTERAYCVGCGQTWPTAVVLDRIRAGDPAPECDCGHYIRPDLVCFGDPLDPSKIARAWSWAEQADLCLVLGSSLVVTPAADLPLHARRCGAQLAIVTLGPTPLDRVAQLKLDQKLSESLVPAVAGL